MGFISSLILSASLPYNHLPCFLYKSSSSWAHLAGLFLSSFLVVKGVYWLWNGSSIVTWNIWSMQTSQPLLSTFLKLSYTYISYTSWYLIISLLSKRVNTFLLFYIRDNSDDTYMLCKIKLFKRNKTEFALLKLEISSFIFSVELNNNSSCKV